MEATLCLELQMKILLACSTLQVLLYNGYEALDVKSLSVGDNRPLRLDKSTKPNQGKLPTTSRLNDQRRNEY